MNPSIGRIVHYIVKESDLEPGMPELIGRHVPAIILGVGVDAQRYAFGAPDPVNLQLFGVPHVSFVNGVPFDVMDLHLPGLWHWPEREPVLPVSLEDIKEPGPVAELDRDPDNHVFDSLTEAQ